MGVIELVERLPPLRRPTMPSFAGATGWLNSEPLTPADLRGRVVLVDFWTHTCINWVRTLPSIRAWAETYGGHGLIVVGVHTPEFSIEHDVSSVRQALLDLRIDHAVAIDNAYAIWEAFGNRYWPALYLADAEGRIRYRHFGEGAYDRSERVIRRLLARACAVDLPRARPSAVAEGIEAAADWAELRSPETYLGLARATGFASPGGSAIDQAREYTAPADLRRNEWALTGSWTLGREAAVLNEPNGAISFRFHARDLHLVLAPARTGPVRFRVRLDGRPPGEAHGLDVDLDGRGVVRSPRLHQLIRQSAPVIDRLFEIELLDAGAAAYCFTFG